MKLGTFVYENQIYNLDYMVSEEVKELLRNVEMHKEENFKAGDVFTIKQ